MARWGGASLEGMGSCVIGRVEGDCREGRERVRTDDVQGHGDDCRI